MSNEKGAVAGSLIADAIEKAVELGNRSALTHFSPLHTKVQASETTELYLTRYSPEGAAELVESVRPRTDIALTLTTLKSFADMLAAPHVSLASSGVPIVQVMPEFVVAHYNPDGHESRHLLCMPLRHSESYMALQKCFKGVRQEDFWKLLATDLSGCFPETFELTISTLGHQVKQMTDVNIERSGIGSSTTVSALTLHIATPKGPQEAEIAIDWTYVGPLWTCFDLSIEIPCRLVISAERGLLFELVPKRLEALTLQHRAALAVELIEMLTARGASIPVYEGEPIAPAEFVH